MRVLALAMIAACGGAPAPKSVEIPLPTTNVEGTYAIRLNRPSFIGERARVVITAEEDRMMSTKRAGQLVSSDDRKQRARIDATVTVIDLDGHHEAGRAVYDVTDLTFTRDARELVHLTHGHVEVTRAHKEDDATVKLDGDTASEELREAVRMLITLRNGGPTDDEIMGTKVPQRVGSHWRIDEKRALEDMATDETAMMSGASVSGDAGLERVVRERGVDCLDIRAKVDVSGLDFSAKLPGSMVDLSRVNAMYEALYPVDVSLGRLSDHMVIEVSVKLRTPSPNGEIKVDMVSVDRRDGTYYALNPQGDASR